MIAANDTRRSLGDQCWDSNIIPFFRVFRYYYIIFLQGKSPNLVKSSSTFHELHVWSDKFVIINISVVAEPNWYFLIGRNLIYVTNAVRRDSL